MRVDAPLNVNTTLAPLALHPANVELYTAPRSTLDWLKNHADPADGTGVGSKKWTRCVSEPSTKPNWDIVVNGACGVGMGMGFRPAD